MNFDELKFTAEDLPRPDCDDPYCDVCQKNMVNELNAILQAKLEKAPTLRQLVSTNAEEGDYEVDGIWVEDFPVPKTTMVGRLVCLEKLEGK